MSNRLNRPSFENSEFKVRCWMKTRISCVELLDKVFGGAKDLLEKNEEHMEKEG
jgi:hypothetical protein